ncbi:MAG TPA: hypothetical protein DCX50_01905 [Limnobacter sp.]|nr:hypothetical protein [Limnobacter sp.]
MELLLVGKRFYLMFRNCKYTAGADYSTVVSLNLRDNHNPASDNNSCQIIIESVEIVLIQ